MSELLPRRARVLVGCHAGLEGEAVGRDDPRVRAHPQEEQHLAWEVFVFPDDGSGGPHGYGYMRDEVETWDA